MTDGQTRVIHAWIDQGHLKRTHDLFWFDRKPEFRPFDPNRDQHLRQFFLMLAKQAWLRGDLVQAVEWVFRAQESLHQD